MKSMKRERNQSTVTHTNNYNNNSDYRPTDHSAVQPQQTCNYCTFTFYTSWSSTHDYLQSLVDPPSHRHRIAYVRPTSVRLSLSILVPQVLEAQYRKSFKLNQVDFPVDTLK